MEVVQVPGVADRRQPAGSHHLGLEPVGALVLIEHNGGRIS